MSDLSKAQAKRLLWAKGSLRWKLHELQRKIYDHFYNGDDYLLTMLIARQSGKSFLMCVLAIETCLRSPNSIVKYVCPTLGMVKNIIKPIIAQIIEDCPDHLKPEWKTNDNRYIFKNGSEIQIASSEKGNYDKIRGGRCHLWIVDEAGFCSELTTIVDSVLKPTTLTTKGKGILASTPDPDDPTHLFISHYVEHAESKGKLFKYTLFDNPMLNDAEKQAIVDDYVGGRENVRFRAEYMCEVVRSPESVVLPEFTADAEKEIVSEYKRPGWFDTYVSMDIGGKDFTVLLLGYFDFINNRTVIEDEIVLKDKQNSSTIANELKRKHRELYGEKPFYMMFSDNNNVILLNDLRMAHNLHFIPTKKDNKEAAINKLRVMIQNRELVINPKCKTLIYHLRNVTWSKAKTSGGYKTFARAVDKSHYDAADALIYFVRNVIYSKNPYPPGYNLPRGENAYIRSETTPTIKPFLKILKRKN